MAVALLQVAAAAAAEPPLVIGVSPFPPHVMQSPEGVRGFDIDIWNEVARLIGRESVFRLMPFEQLIGSVKDGEVDAAVAGISITSAREIDIDFSYPYMDSGLRILTNVGEEPSVIQVFRSMLAETEFSVLGAILAFVLVCSHVLYFAEHGRSGIDDRYFPGIFEAAWCVLATITTVGYGDVTPQRWIGRFVSLVVMVIGIALFGVAIAQLSAGLMRAEFGRDIGGLDDLAGRPVASVSGTTSAQAVIQYGAVLQEVGDIKDGFALLEAGKVEAVLFDASPLMQYLREHSSGDATLVGPLIEPQSYGIALQSGSELREAVNRALLTLQESGQYARIYNRWFGASK